MISSLNSGIVEAIGTGQKVQIPLATAIELVDYFCLEFPNLCAGEAMKIAFVGSRNFCNKHLVTFAVSLLPSNCVVVSGGAKGPDTWAEKAAVARRIETEILKPVWINPKTGLYNPGAGFIRNQAIVEVADVVLAFWDGHSSGTANTLKLAEKANKPNYIIRDTDDVEIVLSTMNIILWREWS